MISNFASENPFALLSLVAAPALLTNAASALALSTSNRFMRAGERLRIVIKELKQATGPADREWWLVHMNRIEKQAMLLLSALRAVYVALGSFVTGSLVAIIGAALAERKMHPSDEIMMVLGLLVGFVGAGSLAWASMHLLRATRLSMKNISEEAHRVRMQLAEHKERSLL